MCAARPQQRDPERLTSKQGEPTLNAATSFHLLVLLLLLWKVTLAALSRGRSSGGRRLGGCAGSSAHLVEQHPIISTGPHPQKKIKIKHHSHREELFDR